MAVVTIESVYGIKVGHKDTYTEIQPPFVRNVLRQQSLSLPIDNTRVLKIATMDVISACLAKQNEHPAVQEAIHQLGIPRVVMLYEKQSAFFFEDPTAEDSMTCEIEVTVIESDSNGRNRVIATTDVYRQNGDRLTSGVAVGIMVPLLAEAQEQEEKVGVFSPNAYSPEQVYRILSTSRDGYQQGLIRSAYLLASPKAIRLCADASGDLNPLHLDREAAMRTPLKGRISQGVWGLGLLLASAEANGLSVRYLSANFKRPVYMWDIIGSEIKPSAEKEFSFEVSKITDVPSLQSKPVIEGKLVAV